MQNCLGIYIESNLIKYAKVSRNKNDYNVEAYGLKFFDNNVEETINKVIEETYSFNVPISINLASESYLYFDIFSLLSKADVQKTVETNFDEYCDENKYNRNVFETRYALVPNIQDKEKIRAIDVAVNKIELNKQKQYLGKHNLVRIVPIGVAVASIAKLDKKENAIIVNMEEKTTITTVYDRQVYNIETIDSGSQEVLEKINKVENSMNKAYEICKDTTIYTSNVVEDTKEQPYLEYIIPTLYKIVQKIEEVVSSSPAKISTIYLTGTLSGVNNIDLYFQEFFPSVDCKILKPNIIEETATQVNIKDYIEVNSAISLAMQGVMDGTQPLNFKKANIKEKLKQINIAPSPKGNKSKAGKEVKSKIDFSFKGNFDKVEVIFARTLVAILLINIIFIVFSKMLYGQMEDKEREIESLSQKQRSEISKINSDASALNSKTLKYDALTEELRAVNDKISNISERRNSIPNLLNQIMYIVPETVLVTSIENTEDKKIVIGAESNQYEKLGYFIARIKLEGYLKNVVSSSGQKSGSIVSIKIEGELP